MVDVTVSDNLAVKWLQETLADGSPVTYFTAEMVGDNWQMRRYARNIHAAQSAELEALRGEVAEYRRIADVSNKAYREKLQENGQLRARVAALDKGLGGIRDGIILIRMLFELEEECDNRAAELTRHINALLNQNGEAG